MASEPLKFYGSSSAFGWGDLLFTEKPQGCYRYILLNAYGVRKGDIHEKYKILGEANEARYEKALIASGVEYEREKVVKRTVDGFPTVMCSGRIDFWLPGTGGSRCVELKATFSKIRLKKCIKDGTPDDYNVAQLIAYMLETNAAEGDLEYAYYDEKLFNPSDPKPQAVRNYRVTLGGKGEIFINNKLFQFNAKDILHHRAKASEGIVRKEILERPHKGTVPFSGACHWCDFKETCNDYDNGVIASSEEFINVAKERVNE